MHLLHLGLTLLAASPALTAPSKPLLAPEERALLQSQGSFLEQAALDFGASSKLKRSTYPMLPHLGDEKMKSQSTRRQLPSMPDLGWMQKQAEQMWNRLQNPDVPAVQPLSPFRVPDQGQIPESVPVNPEEPDHQQPGSPYIPQSPPNRPDGDGYNISPPSPPNGDGNNIPN